MTKATTASGDQVKYGPNWALSRRAFLKIFDDHIECGNWRIDYKEIRSAVLHTFPSIFMGHGYVLAIETTDKTYHFGLNRGRFWTKDLPFEVTRAEKTRLKYSAFSIAVRAILVGYVAYAAWKWIQNR